MQIKIRRFRPSDAEACGKIAAENIIILFQDIQGPTATWNYLEKIYPSNFIKTCKTNKRGREVWVAERIRPGEILGYIIFEKAKKKRDTGHISRIFTRYELRGRGIGAKLIKFAEERIKKKFKVNKVQLYAAYILPTVKFYEKQGYKKKGKIQRVGSKNIKKNERTKAIFMEKKF